MAVASWSSADLMSSLTSFIVHARDRASLRTTGPVGRGAIGAAAGQSRCLFQQGCLGAL